MFQIHGHFHTLHWQIYILSFNKKKWSSEAPPSTLHLTRPMIDSSIAFVKLITQTTQYRIFIKLFQNHLFINNYIIISYFNR